MPIAPNSNESVIILFGGTSSERKVSVASAQNLSTHLPHAELWYWTPQGEILAVNSEELCAHKNAFIDDFKPAQIKKIANHIEAALDLVSSQILYLGLHGGDGENGWLQEKLETRNIFFTGSSSHSSKIAMNKSTSKDLVKKMGLMTADQELLRSNQSHDSELLKKFQKKYSHIVLKPACDGSSSGLSFLSTTEECNEWIKNQFKSQNLWLAEERIIGRELTVGVINHQKCLTVLPPSEVVLERNAHFDYLAKYQGKGNKEITPAILTPKETVDAQTVAILAHSALHCSGYTRTDMIMNDRGMYYLETNTLPGMTKASFIPQQLNAANIDLKLFINGQLEWAKTRYL